MRPGERGVKSRYALASGQALVAAKPIGRRGGRRGSGGVENGGFELKVGNVPTIVPGDVPLAHSRKTACAAVLPNSAQDAAGRGVGPWVMA